MTDDPKSNVVAKPLVAVLGSGSWGTAIAHHLRLNGHSVTLWGRDGQVLQTIADSRENPRYFSGLKLAPGIETTTDLSAAVAGRKLIVFAVPSAAFRSVASLAAPSIDSAAVLVSTAKGLEDGSMKSMTDVLSECCGNPARVTVLSGPSFAREVVQGVPTAVTVAGHDNVAVEIAAHAFHSDYFRVYTSSDVVGVEFGGVVKNVIALAVGVLDGLGAGLNSRAALITRGLAEMQRLTVALGGDPQTTVGLSGLGDLLLTSTGDLSRNRQVGLRLGRGESLNSVLGSMDQVAEAVTATAKVYALARRFGVRTPIIDEVNALLSGASQASESAKRLLSRVPSPERID